ncbi:FAD-dependent monooxygenase [Micromonospora soli]|uniref:FAD-dependent oxidoreductase n=1 Tax=Micromonospora sp. NBRC 110009 TaxID=3061627 RepID=UPI0026736483|nr:FAD-dependent oxidoreductase [Micromonospora sp. NBRC 110009]WKU00426.1 FAD-dependent monooxygenase [Micromonospora sp. NBRC 110009]
MKESRVPVLVVGGSLVGLSTALFLAHHGVKCLLVERHPGTSVHPRAVGYYPRTVELLRGVGLEEAVLKAASGFATHRTRAGVVSLAGEELFTRVEMDGDGELADVTPCRLLLLTQDRLEPLLRARAEQLGADLRFGTELVSFAADAEGVTAEVVQVDTGARHRVRADHLVAADGPRSAVREALGVPRTGRGVLSCHVSIAFTADLAAALRGRRFSVVHVQNPEVRGILVHDDTLRMGTLIVEYDPARGESLDDFTDRRCTDLVRAAIGVPGLPVEIRSRFPWDMAQLTATRYVHGAVLLAGDAAHVIPPTGGYGANTGIADAHNLAWKLAAVLSGTAGPALLETYDAERRPVGELAAAQGALQLAVRSRTAMPAEQNAVLDAQAVTMGYRYGAPDDLVADPRTRHAESGTRAPHLLLSRDGGKASTLDLFGAGFVLLAGPGGAAWCTAAVTAAAGLGVRLAAYRVVPAQAAPGPGVLHDAEGAFGDAYALADDAAVLVRPDGFVAWRSDESEPAAAGTETESVTAALRRILAR